MTFAELRDRKGFSQESIARAVGRSVSTIKRLDKGAVKQIDFRLMAALKRELGPEVEGVLAAQLAAKEAGK